MVPGWRGRADREFRLDPVGWRAMPTRPTLLRLSLAAVLLATATGLLYVEQPASPCPTGTGRGAASASPGDSLVPMVRSGGVSRPGPAAAATDSGQDPDSRAPRLAVPSGAVGVVVTLAEPTASAVVRAGDRVDLVVVAPAGEARRPPASATPATTLASNALVLATPGRTDTGIGLYLALSPERAHTVLALPAASRFAVLIRS